MLALSSHLQGQQKGGGVSRPPLPEIKMNVELTIEELDFLTSLLKEESKNMLEDLSGSEQVQISDTAIRILNDAHDIVSRIHGKLTHSYSSTDNS